MANYLIILPGLSFEDKLECKTSKIVVTMMNKAAKNAQFSGCSYFYILLVTETACIGKFISLNP